MQSHDLVSERIGKATVDVIRAYNGERYRFSLPQRADSLHTHCTKLTSRQAADSVARCQRYGAPKDGHHGAREELANSVRDKEGSVDPSKSCGGVSSNENGARVAANNKQHEKKARTTSCDATLAESERSVRGASIKNNSDRTGKWNAKLALKS